MLLESEGGGGGPGGSGNAEGGGGGSGGVPELVGGVHVEVDGLLLVLPLLVASCEVFCLLGAVDGEAVLFAVIALGVHLNRFEV